MHGASLKGRKALYERWTALSSSKCICSPASHGVQVLSSVTVQVSSPPNKEGVYQDGGSWNECAERNPHHDFVLVGPPSNGGENSGWNRHGRVNTIPVWSVGRVELSLEALQVKSGEWHHVGA